MTVHALAKSRTLKFRKMHGLGNDFVMVDCVRSSPPVGDLAELARSVCDRRFGVGADGLITIETLTPGASPITDSRGEFRMRMWNPDGSESEMCGNGIRCVARYLLDEGITDQARIPIETGAGLLVVEEASGGMIRVDMGVAGLTRGEVGMAGAAGERFIDQPVEAGAGAGAGAGQEACTTMKFRGTAVSMGNPHLVLLVEDAKGIDLRRLGPSLEHHELFPNRTNVHFVQVVDAGRLVQRTWERGAGATLACGTGACASAVAAFLNGKAGRSVDVELPGGVLHVEYAEDGHVFMTGPATTVFDGEWTGA